MNFIYKQNFDEEKFENDSDIFVSASKLFNYAIGDECSDLIDINKKYEEKNESHLKKDDSENKIDYSYFLFFMGNLFEKSVVSHIQKIFGQENLISICSPDNRYNFEQITQLSEKTINLVNKKTPFIYSAPLVNFSKKTYGIADLLIRYDYFEKMFELNIINPEIKNKENKYIVVDIKWKTLEILKTKTLSNSTKYKPYKSQVLIYTEALRDMIHRNTESKEDITIDIAAIVGKSLVCNKIKIKNPFYIPGIVDLNDKLISDTEKAVEWFRNIQKYKNHIDTEKTIELNYTPNLSAIRNYNEKKVISESIKNLSMIYGCGETNKKKANLAGFNKWTDDNLSSDKIGIKGNRAKCFDKIVWINNQEEIMYHPRQTDSMDSFNFSNPCFVDFEFFTENFFDDFSDITNIKSLSGVFLIGIGYMEDSEWKYDAFMVDEMNENKESFIFEKFVDFYNLKKFDCAIYYDVEQRIFDKKYKQDNSIRWINLRSILTSEPFVFKGCYNYKLKSVAQAMNNLGLIDLENESDTKNGMDCMLDMYFYYKNKSDEDSVRDNELVYNTLSYNNFDCKCMYEILNFIKK